MALPALLLFALAAPVWAAQQAAIQTQGAYTGSQSCRECHERFYQLWAPSHHGTAMQAYSDAFAAAKLTPQAEPIKIRGESYQAQIGKGQGWVVEKTAKGDKRLPIKQALGGKNIYYFLTPMEKGRLQTLPVAYDLNKKAWFDTAKSGIRHAGDQAVDWRDPVYTFNTSCHGCHVSQYSLNYDLKTGDYRTTWKEPGINCETCHGPGEAHVKVCQAAPKGTVPKDLRITRGGRSFNHQQNNATCSTCHAKAIPLTQSFMPGDDFWDHYDLALLEHSDYYPDGRDLGENYTYTSWLMSPCAGSGKLDCLHCHTSSGRFRQKKDPNQACLPCHAERVKNAPAHTRHKADSTGNQCIACHMPMTSFAGMHRSDHSMLPPTPAATLKYKSPNACNQCHKDKDAAWADKLVRSWHKDDYQAPVLYRAGLIQAARQRDWSRLPDMLAYLDSKGRDEVFAASLIRLLRACPLEAKWAAVIKAAQDPSPLVRSSALASLGDWPTPQSAQALFAALKDPRRLVRVRAALALAGYPARGLDPQRAAALQDATQEMLRSLMARPDTWHAHYNVGNYYLERGMPREAVHSYQTALKLEPRAVMPRVNLAMAYARAGDTKRAAGQLQKALEQEPDNAAVNFNLGLLKAEQGDKKAAEKYLRAALKADPQMARAAYNLGLLLHQRAPKESMRLLFKAFEASPDPVYAYTLAFFMNQAGDRAGAAKMLALTVKNWPWYADSYLLLADIHLAANQKAEALGVLRQGVSQNGLAPRDRLRLSRKLSAVQKETK
ncbi:MAG: tetratricopeptide repeat protein [Desulfarculaceae bacterium]|nr:tetratricopeptide repeat protein [Desulfarculaceae bacterium]